MEAIVTTKGLSKRYGKINPVNRLNLSVPEGVIYGFLGPNGLRYKLKKLSSTSLR